MTDDMGFVCDIGQAIDNHRFAKIAKRHNPIGIAEPIQVGLRCFGPFDGHVRPPLKRWMVRAMLVEDGCQELTDAVIMQQQEQVGPGLFQQPGELLLAVEVTEQIVRDLVCGKINARLSIDVHGKVYDFRPGLEFFS